MTPQQQFHWKSLLSFNDSWINSVNANVKVAFPDLLCFYIRAFRESPFGANYEDPDALTNPLLANVINSIISRKIEINEANAKNLIVVADTNIYIEYAKQNPACALQLACFLVYAAGNPMLDIEIQCAIPTVAERLTGTAFVTSGDNLKVALAEHFFGIPWVILYQSELNDAGHGATEVILSTHTQLIHSSGHSGSHCEPPTNSLPDNLVAN